jgi:hypothetical protein
MGAQGVLAATQAGLQINQADQQAKSVEAQGRYQKSLSGVNAGYAELQAKDAIERGEKDAQAIKRRGKQIIGSQRAALAAQGVEVDSGTALELQEETSELSQVDALTVRNNAWREAWGYRAEAQAATSAGQLASITAKANARNTLVTGGINAANTAGAGFANDGYFQRTRY